MNKTLVDLSAFRNEQPILTFEIRKFSKFKKQLHDISPN